MKPTITIASDLKAIADSMEECKQIPNGRKCKICLYKLTQRSKVEFYSEVGPFTMGDMPTTIDTQYSICFELY